MHIHISTFLIDEYYSHEKASSSHDIVVIIYELQNLQNACLEESPGDSNEAVF